MYQRIKNENDLLHLNVGTLLIQYPLSGNATDELNLSSPDEFELYEVESVEKDSVRLLQLPSFEPGVQGKNTGATDAPALVLDSLVVKHTDTLVLEKNWWQEDY
ncbi:hypothetical protein LZZ85_04680 [Terrimonas sp. NA20]|uniref:Uncharacterized protein n=1 Tax=Terrimonas ginsenosidimutans TaxID=2908004 RepID=A0ABS9KMP2_9BACT|nr:hypothetical protein [Terrimonas ginsenosidimutans]MCG2613560.1 hypothetical protein [Terrimonas ginsenosidimutans]